MCVFELIDVRRAKEEIVGYDDGPMSIQCLRIKICLCSQGGEVRVSSSQYIVTSQVNLRGCAIKYQGKLALGSINRGM